MAEGSVGSFKVRFTLSMMGRMESLGAVPAAAPSVLHVQDLYMTIQIQIASTLS